MAAAATFAHTHTAFGMIQQTSSAHTHKRTSERNGNEAKKATGNEEETTTAKPAVAAEMKEREK